MGRDLEPKEGPGGTVLLAAAAVLAAVIAGRASLVGSRGADIWHTSVREHIKQMAGMVEDVRYLYEVEAPIALRIVEADIRGEEYAAQARRESGDAAALLRVESETYAQLAELMTEASEIVPDPEYRLEGGGYDLTKRLADLRERYPDLLALDPAATEARGSELAAKSSLLFVGVIPVSVAFLLGALVQGFPARRRLLVAAGAVLLALAVAWVVAVEVVI